jgi:hypothetical protein
MIELAERKFAAVRKALGDAQFGFAAKGNEFGDARAVEVAAEAECVRLQTSAARLIADLVGRTPTQELRQAVEPESLKDVLRRAGVGFDVLMMIGEGADELRASVDERQRQMQELDRMKDDVNSIAASVLRKKLHIAEARLIPLEQKTAWAKEDAIRYGRFYRDFQEALAGVRSAKRGG